MNQIKAQDPAGWYARLNAILAKHGLAGIAVPDISGVARAAQVSPLTDKLESMKSDSYYKFAAYSDWGQVAKGAIMRELTVTGVEATLGSIEATIVCRNTATNSYGTCTYGSNSNGSYSNGSNSNGTNSNGTCSNGTCSNGSKSNGSNSDGICPNGNLTNGTKSNGTCTKTNNINGQHSNSTYPNGFVDVLEDYEKEFLANPESSIDPKLFQPTHNKFTHTESDYLSYEKQVGHYNAPGSLCRMGCLAGFIRTLALAGEIQEKYSTEEGAFRGAELYQSCTCNCLRDNYMVTGSTTLQPEGMIKLLLNGAIEYIIGEVK